MILDDINQKILWEYMYTFALVRGQIVEDEGFYWVAEDYPPSHHFDGEENARE